MSAELLPVEGRYFYYANFTYTILVRVLTRISDSYEALINVSLTARDPYLLESWVMSLTIKAHANEQLLLLDGKCFRNDLFSVL